MWRITSFVHVLVRMFSKEDHRLLIDSKRDAGERRFKTTRARCMCGKLFYRI